jgi:O-antigen ligase
MLVLLCLSAGVAVGLAAALVNPLILLAALPVIAVGVWALRDDERALWLVVLVIGLMPRFAAPVKIGLTPTFLDLALVLLVLAWLVRAPGRPLHIRDVPIGFPLLGLILVAVLTFVIGLPNGALTPLVLRRFVELVVSLALVFIVIAVLRDRSTLERAVRVLILVAALSALIGVILYILPDELAIRLLSALGPFGYPTGPDVLRYILDDPAQMQRATGLWIDPNAYGGFLLISGALMLPQLFTQKPLVPRSVLILSFALIGLALVLTVSRGAMLGLLCVALAIGLVRYRRLLVLVVIAVALALVLPQTRELVSHFAEGFAGRDLATQMRFGEYKDAFRLIERYPVLGVGFADTPDVDLYIGVSSMYLLIAQQMGLLGVTAFAITMLVLFASAAHAWREMSRDESLCAIWLGALGAVAGALISGIFDHYFFNIDFHNSVMLLWLVIGVVVSSQIAGFRALNEEFGTQKLVPGNK